MMIDYIQFATSILLLIGYSSALPTTSNDPKLNRRLLTPGMSLINVDLSDLRILSPESNSYKLNYFGGVGNYHGPSVAYFDPFAKPGQEQPRVNMGPLTPARSQPQPGQYVNMQQAPNKSQVGQLPQVPNQAQGGQQVQPGSQVSNDELKKQPEASDQPQQQSQALNRIQLGQQPQQQSQASGQLQPGQQSAAPNQAQLDQTQAPIQSQPNQQPLALNQAQPGQIQVPIQSQPDQQLPSPNQTQVPIQSQPNQQPLAPNQAQLDQIQALIQSQLGQQSPASNQVQPDQNQNRW